MTRARRIALAVLLATCAGVIGTTSYAAHRVATAGSLTVEVHEKGPDGAKVFVWVPAIVIEIAAPFVGLAVPNGALDEIEPYLPLVRAVSDEFMSLPDVVFVEVTSRDEQIRIEKSGHRLRILVDNRHESLRLDLPLRSIAMIARSLDRAA